MTVATSMASPGVRCGASLSSHDGAHVLDHPEVGVATLDVAGLAATVAVKEGEAGVVETRGEDPLDGDARLGADDVESLPLGAVERALEGGGQTRSEVEPSRERGVDAAVGHHCGRSEIGRRASRRQQQGREAVDADVEQRPPAHGGQPPVVGGIGQHAREGGVGETKRTEHPRREDLGQRHRTGMERSHVSLEQQHAGGVAGVGHGRGLDGGTTEGFLTQDVLARRCSFRRPLGVKVVGQRDVDDLDVRVAQHGLIGRSDSRRAERVVAPIRS